MLHGLDTTLKAILGDSVPDVVRNAEIDFDRPSDAYKPDKTTINLFLYDIRENTELRSNEPVIQRQNGTATIRRPPTRIACSYLVTAWIESGVSGENAILKQHQLLGEVLKVFSRMPTVEGKYLQADLETQMFPIPLVTVQSELMRNPAEFWSALGGKLRPSITLTATIAMDQDVDVLTAPEVSSKIMSLRQIGSKTADTWIATGGTVRNATTKKALEAVDLTLVELAMKATSDADGRFQFAGVGVGNYSIRAAKQGYQVTTKAIQIPDASPMSFDIDLSTI